MSFTILGFNVVNLNDYDVKLFTNFEEDNLYLSKFQLLEEYPHVIDEGSSQRFDKLLFSSTNKTNILKSFPFSGLFKSELTLIKPKEYNISNFISLYNDEYNYILNLYPDSKSSTILIEEYLTKLGVPVQETDSFQSFINLKTDELDEKIFKQSKGSSRLQKKVNPKVSRELKILDQHVKIIDDDDAYAEQYSKLIHEFDNEFLHCEEDKYTFDSSTTQKII